MSFLFAELNGGRPLRDLRTTVEVVSVKRKAKNPKTHTQQKGKQNPQR